MAPLGAGLAEPPVGREGGGTGPEGKAWRNGGKGADAQATAFPGPNGEPYNSPWNPHLLRKPAMADLPQAAVVSVAERLEAWFERVRGHPALATLPKRPPQSPPLLTLATRPKGIDGELVEEALEQALDVVQAVCPALTAQAQALLRQGHGDAVAKAEASRAIVQALEGIMGIIRQAARLKQALRNTRPSGEPSARPGPADCGPARLEPARKPQADKLGLSQLEAARLLSISTKTLRKWIRERGLPCIRVGRAVRIPLDGLQAWIARQTNR
jgi:excisionase family DNA binding protein